MALNTQMATTALFAEATALAALIANGKMAVYDGAQPANGDGVITSQQLLATLSFPALSSITVSGGTISTSSMIQGVGLVTGTNTPTWARIFQEDGVTKLFDISAGASGCNLTMGTIALNNAVTCSHFQHTLLASASGY